MEKKLSSGVYVAYKKCGTKYYRSSITYHGKHISLGSFSDEASANKAYLEATKVLSDNTIQISDHHTSKHSISFEKWVVLCNFRDNGFYIANPIYIRTSFFYYYFTKDDFFLFSKEDLFYYSAHKIGRRGGHYYVADYGSQINIMSRYGIKSHAVAGRDYEFLNGNSQDMQYSNIHVINSYHGVIPENNNLDTIYNVRIHVNGYIKVGSYNNAIEAAIAYNKAADTLKEAGIEKDYAINYIDGLSPKAYADLYFKVQISNKILTMCTK